jgi:hypothetical protein
MTTLPQPHRTRGHRPGYRPTALDDITICIHATPDVDAAIGASLEKYGLAAVRSAMASPTNTADAIAYQRRWPAAPYQEWPPEQEGLR